MIKFSSKLVSLPPLASPEEKENFLEVDEQEHSGRILFTQNTIEFTQEATKEIKKLEQGPCECKLLVFNYQIDPKPRPNCPFTGQLAKYRDPLTKVPFANTQAFGMLRRLQSADLSAIKDDLSSHYHPGYLWDASMNAYVAARDDYAHKNNLIRKKIMVNFSVGHETACAITGKPGAKMRDPFTGVPIADRNSQEVLHRMINNEGRWDQSANAWIGFQGDEGKVWFWVQERIKRQQIIQNILGANSKPQQLIDFMEDED